MLTTPDSLFGKAADAGASDVHIAVDSPATFRINGILTPEGDKVVTPADAEKFVKAVLGEADFKKLKEAKEVDVSYALKNGVRMRVNCHCERGYYGLVARIIPTTIPQLEELDLKELGEKLLSFHEGLILFTGPTGCGKSTSMASLIQALNATTEKHIITLEDPVEFVFPEGKGIIRQRQFGHDFLSFPEALKRILRQDPNVVMVGEMRDLETIAAALTLAETGHLILGTLHTPNAVQTVDRIIDVFPPHQQQQVRSQLSLSLRAVIAQRLVPKVGGGRTAVREVLMSTPAAAHIIRDNRLAELSSVLQTGTELGMRTFERDAKRLYKEGVIDKDTYEMISTF